jgi:hypothetical protein
MAKKMIISISLLFSFAIVNAQKKYHLKGKLVCDEIFCDRPIACGYFAIAQAYKFEIIETDYKTENKYIVGIIFCPDFYGSVFFIKDKIFDIRLTEETWELGFGVTLTNRYENENLPTLYVSEITRAGK